MSKSEPPVPDLKSLLREASRPHASVTVPLKQGLAEQIRQAEAELEQLGVDALTGRSRRAASASPVREKAKQIEALRAEMEASALTFHFEAPSEKAIDRVRQDMEGRDNPVELDLRYTAAACVRVTGPDGAEFPDRMTWQDFRDLREALGEPVYLATVKATSDRVFQPEWSVPFSSAASRILATAK